MSEVTVHLSKPLLVDLDSAELERRIVFALEAYHARTVLARVSEVVSTKPDVSIIFRDFSSSDFELIQEMIDEVVDTIAFYFGDALKGKRISTTVHCTVTDELEAEPY